METTAAPTQKTCTKCLTEKPTSAFHKNRRAKDGLDYHCRECTTARNAERHTRLRNRADHDIDYPAKKRCSDCGETKPASEFAKDRNRLDGLFSRCKLCARWEHIQHKYKLSRSEWEAMWEAQGGRCVICQEPMERDGAARNSLRAVVDHCHGGGQVRALLHSECNRILGFFQDDPAIFRRAARYLELGVEGPVDVARLDGDILRAV